MSTMTMEQAIETITEWVTHGRGARSDNDVCKAWPVIKAHLTSREAKGDDKPAAWRSDNPDAIKAGQKYSDAQNSTYFWSCLNYGGWPENVTLLYEHPSAQEATKPVEQAVGDGVDDER